MTNDETHGYQEAIALRDSTITYLRAQVYELQEENTRLREKASLVDHLQAQLDYEK